MVQKEVIDYGKGISPLYATENPASYTIDPDANYYFYQAQPPYLIAKGQERVITPRVVQIRETTVSRPPTFWQTFIYLLQNWVPRF